MQLKMHGGRRWLVTPGRVDVVGAESSALWSVLRKRAGVEATVVGAQRSMGGWWRVAVALLSTVVLAAAGKFDKYRTCEDCIAAGLGWSRAKQKCGGFENKQCSGATLSSDTSDADAEAAALEAARVEIDATNMAEAKRLAQSSPHAGISAAVQAQQCGKVLEGRQMSLRCPGANTIEGIEFASYGTPAGGCAGGNPTAGPSIEHTLRSVDDCHAGSSESLVEQLCVGKNWCDLTADNGAFGDPCYGSAKYLAVVVQCSVGKNAASIGANQSDFRPQLPPLPRVTMRQLQRRPDLLKGDKPYALLDGAKGWSAMKDWSVDYFLEKFGPDVKSDYFFDGKQQNKDVGRLVPFGPAVEDFHKAQGTPRTPYFLWYVPLEKWRTFESDAMPMHDWLFNQEYNLEQCLGEEGLASVFAVTNWRMILIGQTHTMFNLHTDNVDSATWQTQIKGRKRWRVCPPTETPYLYENKEKRKTGSSDLNTFNVDIEKYPLWQQARCYDYVAIPGDTLYYPPNYWHQTMNLDEETIALTSRILHPSNYKLVFNKFREECAKPPYKVPKGYEPPPRLTDHVCAKLDECEQFVGERVHEMEQFEGDVARMRVDSRKPAQTMTAQQLLKLEL